MKTLIVGSILLWSSLCGAEIKLYQTTDNTGINKKEQIEVMDTYLANLSGILKTMETKLDASVLKISALEKNLQALKDVDLKKLQDQISEKKAPEATVAKASETQNAEMIKLKEDMTHLKNNDIEGMQNQIFEQGRLIEELRNQLKTRR